MVMEFKSIVDLDVIYFDTLYTHNQYGIGFNRTYAFFLSIHQILNMRSVTIEIE